MNRPRIRMFALAALIAGLLAGLTGCVERRFVITSDPPGAMVLDEKGLPLGPTPVDKTWLYNGKYQFTLIMDGYQTLVAQEEVAPRWFEYFPIDFWTENVIPVNFRDIRRFHYTLQPMAVLPPETVLQQGQGLRARGQTIGVPLANDPLLTPTPEMPTAPITVGPPQP
jgi:hypothetical protein